MLRDYGFPVYNNEFQPASKIVASACQAPCMSKSAQSAAIHGVRLAQTIYFKIIV